MERIYYHNITKDIVNESSLCDIVESSELGDVIKFSIGGNALIFDILKEGSDETEGEWGWVRKRFLDYFEEFHMVDFRTGISYHQTKTYMINCTIPISESESFEKFMVETLNLKEVTK